MKKEMDMVRGPLLGKILIFALPIILGSMLQQLFNAVDLAVIGSTGNSVGQAAIGANTTLIAMFINSFVGISMGTNVVVGNYIGQGRRENISKTVHTSMLFAIISGIHVLFVIEGLAAPLLTLLSTPEDVLPQAVLYLRIYALGMPFILFYNFGAAVLRTIGDSKRPLLALLIGGVLNVFLDLVFTYGFHMGVVGVAIATTAANIVNSAIVCVFLLHESDDIRLSFNKLRIHGKQLLKLLQIGVPAAIQALVFSIANLCIQNAINSFGYEAIAGNSVALIFEILSYYIVVGFNQATVTFISQNYGAGELKRCKRVLFITMLTAVLSATSANAVFILFRFFLVSKFTQDPGVADIVYLRFKYVLLCQSMICSYEICASAMRGFGHSLLPALITVFGTCVFRIIWVNTYCKANHVIENVFLAYPISWLITGTAMIIACIIIWQIVAKKKRAD